MAGAAAWWARAEEEVRAAHLLNEHDYVVPAYHHAGHAVEFALKAIFLRRRGLREMPEACHGVRRHDLRVVAERAGLQGDLLRLQSEPGGLRLWLSIVEWDSNGRVPGSAPRRRAAAEVYQAATRGAGRGDGMAHDDLSRDLIGAGAAFLDQLDALGLDPEGAAWLRAHDLGLWRYHVVSSIRDEIGRIDAYGHLSDAFPHGSMPAELAIHDVTLLSPKDALFRRLLAVAGAAGPGSPQRVDDILVAGRRYDALVYRAQRGRSFRGRAGAVARAFAERVRARAAAPAG